MKAAAKKAAPAKKATGAQEEGAARQVPRGAARRRSRPSGPTTCARPSPCRPRPTRSRPTASRATSSSTRSRARATRWPSSASATWPCRPRPAPPSRRSTWPSTRSTTAPTAVCEQCGNTIPKERLRGPAVRGAVRAVQERRASAAAEPPSADGPRAAPRRHARGTLRRRRPPSVVVARPAHQVVGAVRRSPTAAHRPRRIAAAQPRRSTTAPRSASARRARRADRRCSALAVVAVLLAHRAAAPAARLWPLGAGPRRRRRARQPRRPGVPRRATGSSAARVVDFVDLQWWPVFNVADAAIVVGAHAAVRRAVARGRRRRRAEPTDPADRARSCPRALAGERLDRVVAMVTGLQPGRGGRAGRRRRGAPWRRAAVTARSHRVRRGRRRRGRRPRARRRGRRLAADPDVAGAGRPRGRRPARGRQARRPRRAPGRRAAHRAPWCTACWPATPRSRGVGRARPARHRPPPRQGHVRAAARGPHARRAYDALVGDAGRPRRSTAATGRSCGARSSRRPGLIDAPIGRSAPRAARGWRSTERGKEARTRYEVRASVRRAGRGHRARVPARDRAHPPDPGPPGGRSATRSWATPATAASASRCRCPGRSCTPSRSRFAHPVTGEALRVRRRRCPPTSPRSCAAVCGCTADPVAPAPVAARSRSVEGVGRRAASRLAAGHRRDVGQREARRGGGACGR